MAQPTQPPCPPWCEIHTPHKRHEGMIQTFHGRHPDDPLRPMTVQTVLFADQPFLFGVKPIASLGLVLIDPSTRTLRQMSATLGWDSWAGVRDAISAGIDYVTGRPG